MRRGSHAHGAEPCSEVGFRSSSWAKLATKPPFRKHSLHTHTHTHTRARAREREREKDIERKREREKERERKRERER